MSSSLNATQLANLYRSMKYPNIGQTSTSFFANGGLISNSDALVSKYVAKTTLVDGKVQNGTIFISNSAVDGLAYATDTSTTEAAKATIAHELGHLAYQQKDYLTQPPENADIGAKASWCFTREGEASYYAFESARVNGTDLVAGTSLMPNLYSYIANAVQGLTPGTPAYEAAGIAFATQAFGSDAAYVAFCYNPKNYSPGLYVAPSTNPVTGVTYGGGAVWSSGNVPSGGGFWRVPPEYESDSVDEPHSNQTIENSSVHDSSLNQHHMDIASLVAQSNATHQNIFY